MEICLNASVLFLPDSYQIHLEIYLIIRLGWLCLDKWQKYVVDDLIDRFMGYRLMDGENFISQQISGQGNNPGTDLIKFDLSSRLSVFQNRHHGCCQPVLHCLFEERVWVDCSFLSWLLHIRD